MNTDVSELRPRMMSVAYRMLGSVADAEDAVQDAYLRFQITPHVRSPEGFLVRTTTRKCLDQLRAQKRRRHYIGPWVPEPVDTRDEHSTDELYESLSQAFLLMLERLTPLERAAYLLRTVFSYDYDEVARVLGRTEAHVRQLVSRANTRLQREKSRFQPTPETAHALAERFLNACRAGDVAQVEHLFAEDAEVHSDGGGKVTAARVVVRGPRRAARFLAGVFARKRRDSEMRCAQVNGEPGVVFLSGGAVVQVVSVHMVNDRVQSVIMTLNPDKLARWTKAHIR